MFPRNCGVHLLSDSKFVKNCVSTCRRYASSNTSSNTSSSAPPRRRVVVTGTGIVSPLGIGVQTTWNSLLASKSGITTIQPREGTEESYRDVPCKIAAHVSDAEKSIGETFSRSQQRTLSRSSQFALIAAKEALEQSGWKSDGNENEALRAGVAIGSGMVDFDEIGQANESLKRSNGYGRLNPHFITRVLLNLPAGHVAMTYDLRGPNHTVSTACTTGAHAIGDAFNFIRHGVADVMVAGGVETPINALSLAAFCRIRALCIKHNQSPGLASRPFDAERCGFVMGEGCGIVVLEELEHAQKRGANILGEILGYGLSGDAHHVTAPREDGKGAMACMRNAINDARIDTSDIGHINCHATSTPLGDQIELNAIKQLFGEERSREIALSGTKSSTGHLLGAAGALETILALLATQSGHIPPTLNVVTPIDESMWIVGASKHRSESEWRPQSNNDSGSAIPGRRIALSNSFGFGGTNASLAVANFIE